jgi:hypothetical protein
VRDGSARPAVQEAAPDLLRGLPAPRRAQLKKNCLQRIAGEPLTDNERQELEYCIETYLQLKPQEEAELASLGAHEDRRVQAMSTSSLFTWSDRLSVAMEKQGARRVLLGVLEQKFGQLPDEVRTRVERVRSVERLERLAQKALTAKSLKSLRLG